MKKLLYLAAVAAFLWAPLGSVRANDCVAHVPKPRIVLTFEGLVDLVSPSPAVSSPPWTTYAEAWVVAVDASVPTKLLVVGRDAINPHQVTLSYLDSELTSNFQTGGVLKNVEMSVDVPGAQPAGVVQHRAWLTPGSLPSDDDDCSLEWLADMDALSPSSGLRQDVVKGRTSLLDFRLHLDEGTIVTEEFWKFDNDEFCEVPLGIERRALARSFSIYLPVDPTERKLVLETSPLPSPGQADAWEFKLNDQMDEARITIKSHPGGDPGKDFLAHYALRPGWDAQAAKPSVPMSGCSDSEASGNQHDPQGQRQDNPMCSPADDTWP